jgi:AraC-like DNA-binding protein
MLHSLDGSSPVVNSKPVRTPEYSVEIQRSGPALLPAIYRNLHTVTVVLSGEPVVVRDGPGYRHAARFAAGDAGIHPAGPGRRVRWPEGVHCLYVHLHPRLIRRIGEVVLGVPGPDLQSQPRLRDPVIRAIGLELHHLLHARRPPTARTVHDLVMALAHHVTVSYPAPAIPPVEVGTLSLERILDLFRECEPGSYGVGSVAALCGLSRAHFSRRIRALTGLPPHRLALGSRIEASKHLLERREVPLSQVAYAAGFADQSHLTRTFRRATGYTPGLYRRLRGADHS